MRIRYLGHSCVEIIGRHHILIDPDFVREPEPGVEYILVTHAHHDHIGRVADVPTGLVVASRDVCDIAEKMGMPRGRLRPAAPGDWVANIQVLPGFSGANEPLYVFFYLLFRRRWPEPAGTPLSFWVQDQATLLHIGDAHRADLQVFPDILCLPWRTTPFRANAYQKVLVGMAKRFCAPYVLPIHRDLPPGDADPAELAERVPARVLGGREWYTFEQGQLVEQRAPRAWPSGSASIPPISDS